MFRLLLLSLPLLLIVWSLSRSIVAAEAAVTTDPLDVEALVSFFNATGGHEGAWTTSTGWEKSIGDGTQPASSMNPCSTIEPWFGITCSQLNTERSDEMSVTGLMLPNNNLTGALVWVSSWPQRMQQIDLSRNRLYGSLPEMEGSQLKEYDFASVLLNSLIKVDMSNNNFQGSLPSLWGTSTTGAPKLQELSLYNNLINGTIPVTWIPPIHESYPAPKKREGPGAPSSYCAYLKDTTASGSSVGTKYFVGNSLVKLSLYNNQLSGPLPPCTMIPYVQSLRLLNNKFTGELPSNWADLPSLTTLDLRNNDIYGTLPNIWSGGVYSGPSGSSTERQYGINQRVNSWLADKNLTGLTSMAYLDLHNNNLGGVLPSSWGPTMTGMQFLDMSYNSFDYGVASLPDSWASWSSLSELHIQQSRLSGTLPETWGQIFNSSFDRTSEGQRYFMGQLNIVQLSGNQLSGTFPYSWAIGLPKLTTLYLSGNQLAGSLPNSTCPETYKKKYNIPASFSPDFFPKLVFIDLSGNFFNGSIPEEYTSQLQYLIHLDFSKNFFVGSLPPPTDMSQAVAGHLHNLTYVDFSSNFLNGSITSKWFHRKGLKLLLSSNALSGSVPEFTEVPCDTFDVAFNSLSGTLSENFIAGTLRLSGNNLQGTVPKSPFHNKVTSFIDLSKNNFNGPLPPGPWSSTLSVVNLMGNPITGRVSNQVNASTLVYLDVTSTSPEMEPLPDWDLNSITETTPFLARNPVFTPTCSLRNGGANLSDFSNTSSSADRSLHVMMERANCFFSIFTLLPKPNLVIRQPSIAGTSFNPPIRLEFSQQLYQKQVSDISSAFWTKYLAYKNATRFRPITNNSQPPDDGSGSGLSDMSSTTNGMNSNSNDEPPPSSQDDLSDGRSAYVSDEGSPVNFLFDRYVARIVPRLRCLGDGDHDNSKLTCLDYNYSDPTNDYSKVPIKATPGLSIAGPTPQGTVDISWDGVALPYGKTFQVVIDVSVTDRFKNKSREDWLPIMEFLGIGADELGPNFFDFGAQEFTVTSSPFQRSPCSYQSTLAVWNDTYCVDCPLYAACDGTTSLKTVTHVWRPKSDVLPLQLCDAGNGGCMIGSNGTVCNQGYHGPLCALCQPGYGKWANSCWSCPNEHASTAYIVLLALYELGYISWIVRCAVWVGDGSAKVLSKFRLWLSKSDVPLKIIFNHLAIMGLISQSLFAKRLRYNTVHNMLSLQYLFGNAAIFDVLAVNCRFRTWTAVEKFEGMWCAVILILLFEIAAVRLGILWGWLRERTKFQSGHIVYPTWSILVCVLRILHPTIVAYAASVIPCNTYTWYDASSYFRAQPTGTSYAAALGGNQGFKVTKYSEKVTYRLLANDRSVNCDDIAVARGFAWATLVIIGGMIPLLFILMFKRVEMMTTKKENGRIEDDDDHSATNNPNRARETFHFLVDNFIPNRWYWEAVLMFREMTGFVILVMIQNADSQLLGLNVFFVIWLSVHQWAQPFVTQALNRTEFMSVGCAFLSVNLLQLIFQVSDTDQRTALTYLFAALQTVAFLIVLVGVGKYARDIVKASLRQQQQAEGNFALSPEDRQDDDSAPLKPTNTRESGASLTSTMFGGSDVDAGDEAGAGGIGTALPNHSINAGGVEASRDENRSFTGRSRMESGGDAQTRRSLNGPPRNTNGRITPVPVENEGAGGYGSVKGSHSATNRRGRQDSLVIDRNGSMITRDSSLASVQELKEKTPLSAKSSPSFVQRGGKGSSTENLNKSQPSFTTNRRPSNALLNNSSGLSNGLLSDE